jgi:AraC-like DNA-binding protein
MAKKAASIPLHTMPDEYGRGIAIGQKELNGMEDFDEINQIHRDAYHIFFLQEKGYSQMEVDFKEHTLLPYSLGYVHPFQVHRIIKFENVLFTALMINSENIKPEFLPLLQGITPTAPLQLPQEDFLLLSEAAALCVKLYERKDDKMYHSLLHDSCNTFIGLIISQYTGQNGSTGSLSRFEAVANDFKAVLERDYIRKKRPSEYAALLNISTAYLNECVKNVTGFPVSHHIQQRVILEAKRLLSHTAKSVKEIAADLGYEDYPYFSRLFAKTTGMTALVFRNKNRD